ncbi:MAG: hypothetical protein GC164_05775 [Phycisphaera sp.]|nr:hypothetical protein [Phycisphaera sp.]
MPLQDQLRELFHLDQQVRGLRTRLDAAQRRLKIQKTKAEQIQRQMQELASQYKQAQAAAGNFETEVKQAEQRVNKLREQMNTVTSNKEYSALLVEVNTLKLEKGKVEEKALEQMTKADLLKQEVVELDAKLTEQNKLVAAAEAEVKESRDEVGARLDEAQSQRDAAATTIPPEVKVTFDRLLEAHDGEAMANIIEENRRAMEYTCGGCYIQVPVELVNALSTRPDEMILCPSCKRILYIDKELKGALAGKK